MGALCIIPARGGSKRIPRKNVRSLLGRPLLVWTIEVALDAGLFEQIVVSTDDDTIAEFAVSAGAAVFRRSAETASDTASTSAALLEVLEQYTPVSGGFACCLYATAALLRSEHLRLGAALMRDRRIHDSAMSVQAYRHPIERALRLHSGCIQPIDARKMSLRTQELEPTFHDAGQFYFFQPEILRETGRLLGRSCAPVLLQSWEAVDLDRESDWQLLEQLMAARLRAAEAIT